MRCIRIADTPVRFRHGPLMQMDLSQEQISTIKSINQKVQKLGKEVPLIIIGYKGLNAHLTKTERQIIKLFSNLNPYSYGFSGPYFGITRLPKDLQIISGQSYTEKGKKKLIQDQYLPKSAFQAYQKLKTAIFKDLGLHLLVESGYRSAAYQTMTFLSYLEFYKFNVAKTAKRVAIAGYSEHGFPKGQALDFKTIDGHPTDANPEYFAKTKEYAWLKTNAARFGFSESYPKNNKQGIMYEPWHWALRKAV